MHDAHSIIFSTRMWVGEETQLPLEKVGEMTQCQLY